MTASTILEEACALVYAAVAAAPNGLTASEAQLKTGLYLDVPAQKGYICWTVLRHLVHTGRLVKIDKRYRVPQV